MSGNIIIYGAYGFTGELIAREALRQDIRPIIAGRDASQLARMHEQYGLEVRVADLDDALALDAMLEGCDVVIHCAGPFSATARQMADACLRTTTSYVDITGEFDVICKVLDLDAQARSAGIVMLPGAGFDVVPSDCLIATVADGMQQPLQIDLALLTRGSVSRGTATTMAQAAGVTAMMYADGSYVPVPASMLTRTAAFMSGSRQVRAISWGDIGSAPRSVHARRVTTYATMGTPTRTLLGALDWAGRSSRVRRGMQRAAVWGARRRNQPDPDRLRQTCELWVRVEDARGHAREGVMTTGDGYDLTAASALRIAIAIRNGEIPTGALTPSQALGSSFASSLPGTQIQLLQ